MKHFLILGLLIPIFIVSCTHEDMGPADVGQEEFFFLDRPVPVYRNAPTQIEGRVYWPDSTAVNGPEQGGDCDDKPCIKAYLAGKLIGTYGIDLSGHYGFSGPDSVWETGTYSLETDVMYRDEEAYQGHRASYPEEGEPTHDQDVYLTENMTK